MLRVNNLSGFGGGRRVTALTFVDSAVSNAATITIPAAAQAGDLAVLLDHGSDNPAAPADVVPAGWTGWGNSEQTGNDGGSIFVRARMSYKILASGEPGAAVTGIDGAAEQKVMAVFRGNAPITVVTASTALSEFTTGNPASQSATASSQPTPLVVIGGSCISGGTAAFSVASPAFDAEVATADDDARMGYKVYNSAPADHTIDMADLGGNNYLTSGYLRVS